MPLLDFDEDAEIGEVAHLGRGLGTDGILGLDFSPRIGRKLLDTERHLALVAVEREDDGLDLVADLHELLSRTQVLAPRHFGNVDETLDTGGNLDESTVIGHDNDLTLDLVANLEVLVERFPGMGRKLL